MRVQHIADQRRAFEAALAIAKQHPSLPSAYIVVSSVSRRVDFQLETLTGWEAWREALAPKNIDATALGTGDVLLTMDTVVGGFDVHVYVIEQIHSARASQVPVKPLQQQEDPHPNGDPLAYGASGIPCGCGKDAHSNLVPCRQVSREDTYTSPLHHDYTTPHDLPEVPAQRDRRHV